MSSHVVSTGHGDEVLSRLMSMIAKKIVDPWKSKLLDVAGALGTPGFMIRFSNKCLLQGSVVSTEGDLVRLCPHFFQPGLGFVVKPHAPWDVHVPLLSTRAHNMCVGDSVTLFGKIESEHENGFHFEANTCIVPVAEWDWSIPVNSFHLFAGSFNGWSQAMEAIFHDVSFPPLGQQVCVDSDPVTMSLWSHQVGKPHHLGKSQPARSWNPCGHIGVCTSVGDTSLIHQVDFRMNSIGTASPPCVSWSKAGKSKGLNSDAGYAFIEALVIVFVLRPSIQLFECADEIIHHQHFGLVSHMLKLGGYKRIWQQNLQFHRLSDNHRDRWFSAWIRADHSFDPNQRAYVLQASSRVSWHDSIYRFYLPQEFRDALHLTNDLKTIYGAHHLLPPSKKARCMSDRSQEQVLAQRAAPLHEPLPTFCAMYGKQHELDPDHVANKGLFACLEEYQGSFAFIDPARIVALLGGTNRISLPSDPFEAFHGLGNAVSVPQAATAILVGLQAINRMSINVEHFVEGIWNKRLTVHNAVIVKEDCFISIVDARLFWDRISFQPAPVCMHPMKYALQRADDHHPIEGSCSETWTVAQLLANFAHFEPHVLLQISLRTGLVVASAADLIQDLMAISSSWDVCAADSRVAVLQFEEPNLQESDPIITPTCPFVPVPQVESIQIPSQSFDQEIAKDSFIAMIRFFEAASTEGLLSIDGPSNPIVICCVDPQVVFVTTKEANAGFEEIHAMLHRVGFAQWTFRSMNSRSVRLPGHEWWLLHNPDLRQCSVIIENLSNIIDYQIIDVEGYISPTTTIHRNGQIFVIQRINGMTFDGNQVHECRTGDVLTVVHQDPLLRRVENTQRVFAGGHPDSTQVTWHLRAGANFSERCEFAINTNGWCASDELNYAMRWLLETRGGSNRTFAILQWNGQDADLDETTFILPNLPPGSTSWLAILIGSHWAGCEVTRCGDDVLITFLGIDSPKAHRLTQILARRLDTTGRKIQSFVHAFTQPFNMCGWALIFRWYEKLGQHDQLHSYEEDLEDLVEWKYSLVHDVLSSSVEDWLAVEATPELWHFAHQIRLGCFYHMALAENDAAPVVDHTIIVDLPRGPTLQCPGRILYFEEYNKFLKEFQNRRVDEFHRFPGWLGSDVADCTLQHLRTALPAIAFTAPVMWNSQQRTLCTFSGYSDDCRYHRRAITLILYDQHWISCEFHRRQDSLVAWVLAPHDFAHDLQCLTDQLRSLINFGEEAFQLIHLSCDTQLGLCGWTLLQELFNKLEISLPCPGIAVTQCIAASMDDSRLQEAIVQANELWVTSTIPGLHAFAQDATIWFLYDLFRGRFTPAFASGGALTTGGASSPSQPSQPVAMQVDPTIDLLQVRDPWAKKTSATQAKWEDLRLDSDHPFRLADKSVVPQVHRHQLTGAKGGIVLITKNQLTEIAKIQTKQPLAAVIPVIDHGQLQQFSKLATGPFEIVVHDGVINTSYKRIVTLLTFEGKITYSLTASPAFEFKTNAIAEIVIEIDNRLCSKECLDSIRENPLRRIQSLLQEKFPHKLDHSTFYALRQNKHPSAGKQDFQYQCIMKVSHEHRSSLLQASGQDGLLLRDFLERNNHAEDLTVLPKFWPCNTKGLHEINIAAQALPGSAGVSLTKRGLALRVWTSHIKEARRHLLPNDIRLCEENIHIVPKCQVASSGWPPGAAPVDIVKATLKATTLAAIPLRTYRSAGVHVWILCFEKVPTEKQFNVSIDAVVHEILLTEYQPQQFGNGKAAGKGKDRGVKKFKEEKPTSWTQAAPIHERARIDALETKFEQLGKQVSSIEQRQSSFETKFDGRFDEIGDVLRQLLNQSSQRSREATGETPPSKLARQGP